MSSSYVFQPLSLSHQPHVTRGLSLAYALVVSTCVVHFSRILMFMVLPLDGIMDSKQECKSDN
jgi:hypothetical protein